MTDITKRFLCVKEEELISAGLGPCTSQCWQCQHIEEVEELDQEPEDDGEDANVEDSDAR